MRPLEWALIHYGWCPYKKRLGHKHKEKAAIYKPKREASGGTNPTDPLILGIQPLKWRMHSAVKAVQSVALCCGSSRRLIHLPSRNLTSDSCVRCDPFHTFRSSMLLIWSSGSLGIKYAQISGS